MRPFVPLHEIPADRAIADARNFIEMVERAAEHQHPVGWYGQFVDVSIQQVTFNSLLKVLLVGIGELAK